MFCNKKIQSLKRENEHLKSVLNLLRGKPPFKPGDKVSAIWPPSGEPIEMYVISDAKVTSNGSSMRISYELISPDYKTRYECGHDGLTLIEQTK